MVRSWRCRETRSSGSDATSWPAWPRVLLVAGVGVILLVLPMSVQVSARGVATRVNEACGQATGCLPAPNYICSTSGADIPDNKCTAGCEPPRA